MSSMFQVGEDPVTFGAIARTRAGGSVSVNTEPSPGVLWMSNSPPWRPIACLTMAKPSPVPPVPRERLLSTR